MPGERMSTALHNLVEYCKGLATNVTSTDPIVASIRGLVRDVEAEAAAIEQPWFAFSLGFLGESDQKSVANLLAVIVNGRYTVRMRCKSNADTFDARILDMNWHEELGSYATEDGVRPRDGMLIVRKHDNGCDFKQEDWIAYEDIEEIGIY